MINELRFNRNEPMIQEQSSVGRAMPSTSSQAKATGQADFGDDLRLKGLLVGKVLRSPHPRARVLSVDTAKARAMPGVIAVPHGWGHVRADGLAVAQAAAGANANVLSPDGPDACEPLSGMARLTAIPVELERSTDPES